jgi:hypothetical protein
MGSLVYNGEFSVGAKHLPLGLVSMSKVYKANASPLQIVIFTKYSLLFEIAPRSSQLAIGFYCLEIFNIL